MCSAGNQRTRSKQNIERSRKNGKKNRRDPYGRYVGEYCARQRWEDGQCDTSSTGTAGMAIERLKKDSGN